ncbi:MAG: cytochrome c [Rhodanobacteraceae bacterium]|nr:cytochrome c [Rhodanobacteraceae bacterium]MBL0041444.1 cytochrome c [Xanthomonadales bacterium]MBP6078905.1 cytochrome c [Xanthomonadales bacterium]
MRQFFLISAVALFAVAPTAFAGDAAAGKAKSTVCAACHGPDGNKPIDANTPKLAGQHEDYLVKVLKDYRSGARANAIMGAQAANLKDQDIDDLAAYFASQKGDIKEIPHH